MIRITQRSLDIQTAGQLEALHAAFVRITSHQVPPSVGALYATPKVVTDGTVQWLTPLSGQPTPYAELPVEQAIRLKTLLFERLSALRQYAETLGQQTGHDPAAVQLLKHASAEPPLETVFSVNGQPVLLYWNQALPADPRRQILAAPRAPIAAAAAGATAGVLLTKRLRWLIALLLLLLVLFLLWWFFCSKSWRLVPSEKAPISSPVALAPPLVSQVSPPVTPPTPEVTEPAHPPAAPEPPVVRKPVDPPIVDEDSAPPLVEVPEPEPELLRAPTPPVEPPKPEPIVAPPKIEPPTKPPVPKVVTVENAKLVCPDERPAALAPELLVVFDASGSMAININATQEEEEWVNRIMSLPAGTRLSASDSQKLSRLHQEPTRIMAAKQSTIRLLQRLPKDIGTGLVVVDDCPTSRNLGRYAPGQRNQMIGQLSQLSPKGGTPLADGLHQAGELADGVTRESTILLVSDGAESCRNGGDVCYVARNLKRQKPHLKVNVVDIGGAGGANCAAEITGGKVFTVSSVKDLNLGLDRAAQDTLGPAQCKN